MATGAAVDRLARRMCSTQLKGRRKIGENLTWRAEILPFLRKQGSSEKHYRLSKRCGDDQNPIGDAVIGVVVVVVMHKRSFCLHSHGVGKS